MMASDRLTACGTKYQATQYSMAISLFSCAILLVLLVILGFGPGTHGYRHGYCRVEIHNT